MSKKAVFALLIALLLPIIGYFLIKFVGERNVQMPKHYLLDSVNTAIKNGKITHDSVWHTVQNIRLTNQLGQEVNLYDIQGKVIVLDIIFTSCGSICPQLTRNMARMQRSFITGGNSRKKLDSSLVHFISLTIDPKRDTAERLKQYADNFGVVHDNWWLLTGNKDSIYNFIFEQLKVDKYDTQMEVSPDFPHTGRYVLIDKNFQIRGYYNGLDTLHELPKMAQDIGLLMVEKDKKKAGILPFDPIVMGLVFFATLGIVIFFAVRIFKRQP